PSSSSTTVLSLPVALPIYRGPPHRNGRPHARSGRDGDGGARLCRGGRAARSRAPGRAEPDSSPSLTEALELIFRETGEDARHEPDRKSTRLNSSHDQISYA